jgi:zinc protease
MQLVSEHPFGNGGLWVRHFRLDNGLSIILLRDPSAPIIAYQTWFKVGSRHEHEGRTGIAHLFEHLMFNQTESLPPGEFDRRIEKAGGETNAATWVDWTFYRDNLPKSSLELGVKLESERMAHLVLGDQQVESEREVVVNERLLRVEDDIDGFLSEELYKLAFTTHPYHWPTIGWMQDIRAISIADCRAFYRTYYAPNNATLVIVGDFDEPKALELISSHYGKIPAQPIPEESTTIEPPQTSERRIHFQKPVNSDRLQIGYKSPPLGHSDHPVLEVASEILFGGNSSRLYRALVVEGEIASSVHASVAPFRDAGLYEVSVALQRGRHAEEAEKVIYDGIASLESGPIDEAELETARVRLETRFLRALRSQDGKAEDLGQYHTTVGDYRRLFSVDAAYRAVTLEDVRRVIRTYLQPSQRTVVVALPPNRRSRR